MHWLERFLLICSGSDFRILEKSPTEKNKHMGIGGVILFTALLAALSAGYALFTIFDNIWIAAAFGVFWGLMIFNLDRFIVASMRKSGNFFRQFFTALPRIALAALLGIIISKPLELKIFEKEINKQLNTIIVRNKKQLLDSVSVRYASLSASHQQERNQIHQRIQTLRNDYNQATTELEKEIVGTATETTTGKQGYGANAKRKEQIKLQKKEDLDAYLAQMQPRLKQLDAEVDELTKNKTTELKETSVNEDKYNGFAARIQALDELSNNNKILGIASLFIMGLFVSIEMAPVLVKLIAPKGPYDYLLEKHEYAFKFYGWESKAIIKKKAEQRVEIHQHLSDKKIQQSLG